MKTTDSVMREFDEKFGFEKEATNMHISHQYVEMVKAFIFHSLAEARRELIDEIYDKGVGSTKQEAGIYYPFRAMAYLERLHYEQHKSDLLTGDNPEEAK